MNAESLAERTVELLGYRKVHPKVSAHQALIAACGGDPFRRVGPFMQLRGMLCKALELRYISLRGDWPAQGRPGLSIELVLQDGSRLERPLSGALKNDEDLYYATVHTLVGIVDEAEFGLLTAGAS